MSKARIPPDLEPVVAALWGRGASTRQIASALRTEHGIEVHHSNVAHLVGKQRGAVADVVDQLTREKVERTVGADLNRLAFENERLERALPELACSDFGAYLKGLHVLCRIVEVRFEIAGLVNPKRGKRTLEDLLDDEGDTPNGEPPGVATGSA